MIPYVTRYIPIEDIVLFGKIRKAVERLPEINFGKSEKGEEIILSCHILARAVAKVFGLKFVDGHLYPHYQHSWLLTSSGNIIDTYPVAVIGGPIIVDNGKWSRSSPARFHYKKKGLGNGFNHASFRRSVRKVVKALKEAPTNS